jgi:hypothetical protein
VYIRWRVLDGTVSAVVLRKEIKLILGLFGCVCVLGCYFPSFSYHIKKSAGVYNIYLFLRINTKFTGTSGFNSIGSILKCPHDSLFMNLTPDTYLVKLILSSNCLIEWGQHLLFVVVQERESLTDHLSVCIYIYIKCGLT